MTEPDIESRVLFTNHFSGLGRAIGPVCVCVCRCVRSMYN